MRQKNILPATKSVFCPAKINLFLEVTGQRADGYHDIDSVMQKISLCDRVTVTVSEGSGIGIRTSDRTLPTGPRNLAYRAAEAYLSALGVSYRIDIALFKKIPVAAGLAGGSTDAAGVLQALHAILGGLSRKELLMLALSLGADVPFCLDRSSARCRGLGELLSPCPGLPDCRILVVRHRCESVSTRDAYCHMDEGRRTVRSGDSMQKALVTRRLDRIGAEGFNAFESFILPGKPAAAEARRLMREAGAYLALMSGSGPSVFGLFDSTADTAALEETLARAGNYVFAVRPWR